MNSQKEPNIVARRELELHCPDGTVRPVHIEVAEPQQCSDSEDYHCQYRILGLYSSPVDRASYGVDSLQALLLCIRMISIDLEVARRKFDLTWLGTDENNLGLGAP